MSPLLRKIRLSRLAAILLAVSTLAFASARWRQIQAGRDWETRLHATSLQTYYITALSGGRFDLGDEIRGLLGGTLCVVAADEREARTLLSLTGSWPTKFYVMTPRTLSAQTRQSLEQRYPKAVVTTFPDLLVGSR